VVGEGETPKGEDHLSTPAKVVRGRRVQHDGHEGPNVVDPSSLGVECGDGVGVEPRGMGVLEHPTRQGGCNRRWWCVATEEKKLGIGQLSGQCLAHGTLLLPGEGSGVLSLLRGGHSSLDGSNGGCQRGVGSGCQGSPSDVEDRWARGLEARWRLSEDTGRRWASWVHGECEGSRVCRVAREAELGSAGGSSGNSSAGCGRGGRRGCCGRGGEIAAGVAVGGHGGVGDGAAEVSHAGGGGGQVGRWGRVAGGRGSAHTREVRHGRDPARAGAAREGVGERTCRGRRRRRRGRGCMGEDARAQGGGKERRRRREMRRERCWRGEVARAQGGGRESSRRRREGRRVPAAGGGAGRGESRRLGRGGGGWKKGAFIPYWKP
jgi:hypothetical protein